jgi:poly(hydroxyalkanoate) granule-associated protein
MMTGKKTPPTSASEPAASAVPANPILKALRSTLLIVIGTFALGKEEIEAIVNRLVEKGELAEKDARELLSDLLERRKDLTETTAKVEAKLEDLIDARVEAVLDRLNVPSRRSVEDLARKIAELAEKVDELTRRLSA